MHIFFFIYSRYYAYRILLTGRKRPNSECIFSLKIYCLDDKRQAMHTLKQLPAHYLIYPLIHFMFVSSRQLAIFPSIPTYIPDWIFLPGQRWRQGVFLLYSLYFPLSRRAADRGKCKETAWNGLILSVWQIYSLHLLCSVYLIMWKVHRR